MNKAGRWIVETTITALFGFAAFIAPVLLDPPKVLPKSPLFPVIREAVEHLRPSSIIALASVGFIAGLLARASWPVLGMATVALLPICTIAELVTDPTSHNLFPFEFATYAMFSIPAIITAGIGRGCWALVRASRAKNRP